MEHLSECIIDFFVQKNIIKKREREIYSFGALLILNDILTFLILILLSVLFFKFRYAIEYIVTFSTMRNYIGGYHAESFAKCRFYMLLNFLIICYLSNNIKEISSENSCDVRE